MFYSSHLCIIIFYLIFKLYSYGLINKCFCTSANTTFSTELKVPRISVQSLKEKNKALLQEKRTLLLKNKDEFTRLETEKVFLVRCFIVFIKAAND